MHRKVVRYLPLVWGVLLQCCILFSNLALAQSNLSERPATEKETPQEASLQITEKSGLPDYLAYAASNNPGLEAAFDRWQAALERIPQVTALPDPKFSYGYYIREVETKVGPQRQRFGLAQTFPWFGKLDLKGKVAARAADAEKGRYEQAKLRLFYRVKKTFYEYAYLAKAVQVATENLTLLRYLEEVAQVRYASNLASHHDLVKAQVESAKLEDRRTTLIERRQPLVAQLNAEMNRPIDQPLPWPTTQKSVPGKIKTDELMALIAKANPEMGTLDSLAAREDVRIKLKRTEYYPNFTLGVQYIDTLDADNPNIRDSGKDPVIAGISINLPIWFSKYEAGVQEAAKRKSSFVRQKQGREKQLKADARLALYRFQDAGRKIDLYQTVLIPKAKENFNVSLQGYQSGQAMFLDLIDTVRTLIELELVYERAKANRATSLAELEMIAGRELTLHYLDGKADKP